MPGFSKRKIFNFSFLALSNLRDEVPNVLRFLNGEKRLSAPSNFDGSAGDNLQNGFNKIAKLGAIILLSFFEY